MAIPIASLTAGKSGFLWLKLSGKPKHTAEDTDSTNFESDM